MKHYISRRKFLIASGVAAAATALSACGETATSTSTETSTSTSTADSTASSEAVSADPITLRWVVTAGGGKQQDADMVAEAFNKKLQETMPHITVEFDYWMPSEYKEKFDLAMAGGETIDIAWKGYMMQTAEYFQSDTFIDLASFVASDSEMTAEIPQFLFDVASVDGQLCYLPKYEMHHWMEGIYTPTAAYDAYFDREAFDAAAAAYLETEYRYYTPELYDVLEDYMVKAEAGGMLGSGYSPYVSCMDTGADLISGSPGLQNVPFPLGITVPATADVAWDTTIINHYERPETRAYFEKLADWKAKGFLRNDLLTLENPRQYENTNVEGDLIWYHNYVNADDATSTGVHVRLGSERGWDADYNVIPLGTPTVLNGSSDGLCIPYSAQDPAVSYSVMRLMFTEEGKELRNMLVWGLEDVHYTKTGDNRVERFDDAGEQEDDTYGLPTWGLGNCHKTWLLPTQPDNQYDYYDEMVQASIISPTLGFNYVVGDFDAEINNIRNKAAEYVPSFNAGDYTAAKYDEFLAELAQTKLADIQADLQAQLDAFMA